MVFATQYKKNDRQLDVGGGEKLVQTQGYISAQDRIENMMLAGQRLIESRTPAFDFEDVDDPSIAEVNFDYTRRRNYDMADATQDALAVEQRIKDRARSNQVPKAVDADVSDGDAVGQETSPVGEAGK